ncbi:hypothetical protein [Clostridioides difficile]|nr:hypothetical protein [Clostridioides difficile]
MKPERARGSGVFASEIVGVISTTFSKLDYNGIVEEGDYVWH